MVMGNEAKLAVTFKKGRAGKRRARIADGDEPEGDAVGAFKRAKPDLKGALKFSTNETKASHNADDVYTGTGGIQEGDDGGATRALQEETEHHRDRRAQKEAFMRGEQEEDGKYRGQAGYKDWTKGLRREDNVPIHGPQRVSTFVRTTIRVDYQPDICKDYKETGFCAYGDTCKFLHDRGDYKQGWELDKEWEEQQKAKKDRLAQRLLDGKDPEASSSEDEDDDSDEEDIPFACFICRRNWPECDSPPVKTACSHFFCEKCALGRFSKNKRCAVCEKPTMGIFNAAPEVEKKYELQASAQRVRQSSAVDGDGWTEDAGGWSTEADEVAGV